MPKPFTPAAAATTLKGYQERWDEFCKEFSTAVQDPVNESFNYVKDVLGSKKMSAGEMIKDGLAIWIQGGSSACDVYHAAYNLWCPPAKKP